jgi:hypothetical protein
MLQTNNGHKKFWLPIFLTGPNRTQNEPTVKLQNILLCTTNKYRLNYTSSLSILITSPGLDKFALEHL